jgi:hypothetical protein
MIVRKLLPHINARRVAGILVYNFWEVLDRMRTVIGFVLHDKISVAGRPSGSKNDELQLHIQPILAAGPYFIRWLWW